jgi:WD40 repeat protein/serine/threonine protein kinase
VESFVGQVIKGYELREEIGAGGFGAVYRAYQAAVGREVAMKIILPQYANNPEFIRRFESEAQMVARLEHLHIVPLYDYWREPDSAYLVMRYLRGGSARDHLRQHGPWPLEDVGRLLEHITTALTVAHRNQIIHRDLKPDNILMDASGNFFLADFGIAKDMSDVDAIKTAMIIGSPAYFSPEQIEGNGVTPRTDIYSLGICVYELLTGHHPFDDTNNAQGMIYKHLTGTIPEMTIFRENIPPALQAMVERATAKNPADRFEDALLLHAAYQKAVRTADQPTFVITQGDTSQHDQTNNLTPVMGTTIPEPENPYKGLRAFREADSEDFFGRETLIAELLRKIDDQRLLTIIGPSGSGKSSVVHAGVVPQMRRGALLNSENWFYVMIHPDVRPLEELESALLRVAVNPPTGLMSQLIESERGFLRALKRTLPDDNSELVLVVDQFEELFTVVEDEGERKHFLDSLRLALKDPRSRLRVIITLRADFYDRPLLYPAFGEMVRESTTVVLPLSEGELELAITGPAERVGLVVEPELVAAMTQDVGATTSALPMLQYALTELYERRDGRTLTVEAYRDIGGVSGALARRAEEIYVGLWEPTKHTAREVFLRLVNLGEGTEDTRRRVSRTELRSLNPDEVEDAVEYCLEQFGKYRLLTFDHDPQTRKPTVEVAHEALIREWRRLRGWLDENRDDLRTQRKLSQVAAEWHNADRDPSFLARGTRLGQFREWQNTTSLTTNAVERSYLTESIRVDEARIAAEKAQREREAALEKRSQQRLRALFGVATVAAVVGIILSVIAFNRTQAAQQNADALATSVVIVEGQRAAAERNAEEAQSLALAASAQQAFSTSNNDLAIAFALEANLIDSPPAQAQRVLAEAAYAPGTRRIFSGHTNIIQDVAFSNDGTRIASASADGTLRLWDVETGETLKRFTEHSGGVNAVDIASNQLQLLSASADGSAQLWDIETGNVVASVRPSEGGGVLTAHFSPDGRSALIGDASGSSYIWDLNSSLNLQHFAGHTQPVFEGAFNPRGTTFLTASADGTMRLWSVNTGNEIRRFLGHEARVQTVFIASDGLTAVSGDANGSIRVWDVRFGQQIKQLFGHTAAVNALEVTPDSRFAVSGSEDGTVRVWNLNTSEEIRRFRGHTAAVTAIAISPDGRRVVSGSRDNTLRLWDLQSGAEVQRITDEDEAFIDTVVSSDGRFALSGGRNGGLAVWDLETSALIRSLSTTKGTVGALAASPDTAITAIALSANDRLALSGQGDGTVVIWDVNSGTDLRRVSAFNGRVVSAAFMPDNRQVVVSGTNQLIRLDAGTGETVYAVELPQGTLSELHRIGDTEQLLAATSNGALLVVDGADGSVTKVIGSHDDTILAIDINADASRALTGSRDETLRLWDLTGSARNPLLMTLTGHNSSITGVSLSADETVVVSGAADRSIIVWDMALETPVQQLTGHTAAINAVHLLPGDQYALSASADGTLRVWQTLDLTALVDWASDNRHRTTFTCAQREQYRIEPLCIPIPD